MTTHPSPAQISDSAPVVSEETSPAGLQQKEDASSVLLTKDRPPSLILEATAFTSGQLIHPHAPQVALAGRSNVGKSSLVNALANRKALAKVSATPGKTRSINYYKIDPLAAYLVDLPGYGYAKCSHDERNKWAELLEEYLRSTPGLLALVLLLDSRLMPQKLDKELAAFAASNTLLVIPVLTKADKCNKKELAACKKAWGALLGEQSILTTSSQAKSGIDTLWELILQIVQQK